MARNNFATIVNYLRQLLLYALSCLLTYVAQYLLIPHEKLELVLTVVINYKRYREVVEGLHRSHFDKTVSHSTAYTNSNISDQLKNLLGNQISIGPRTLEQNLKF